MVPFFLIVFIQVERSFFKDFFEATLSFVMSLKIDKTKLLKEGGKSHEARSPTIDEIYQPEKIGKESGFVFSWQDFVDRNFYIGGSWSIDYYFSVRGAENFHIYIWIAKDLAWAQDLYWPAMIFGSMALAWCLLLAFYAFKFGGIEEIYMLLATILWLSGNFVWMAGIHFPFDRCGFRLMFLCR
jgi:hypothetical protein